MPKQKRVHFSENCLTFAPITNATTRTPSPTTDDSDPADSPDPPTPPPMQYVPSPYPFTSPALMSSLSSPPGAASLPPPPTQLHQSQFSTPMPGFSSLGLPTPTPSPPNVPLAGAGNYKPPIGVGGGEAHNHHHHHHHHQMMMMMMGYTSPQPMNVHHLLAYTPSAVSPLVHDVVRMPHAQAMLSTQQQHSQYSQHPPPTPAYYELDEPATNPPLPQMFITSSLLPDNWQIKVVPTGHRSSSSELDGMFSPAASTVVFSPAMGVMSPDSSAGGYVTVMDVLICIYTSLRTIVHPTEYDSLTRSAAATGAASSPSASHHTEESVTRSYWARVAQIEDPKKKEDQRKKGVRRVDFLGPHTRFLGLTGTLRRDVWELELGE